MQLWRNAKYIPERENDSLLIQRISEIDLWTNLAVPEALMWLDE